MARINDRNQLSGSMGKYTFCATSTGQIVRSKSSLTANRFRHDKAFAGSRAHAAEFGRASSAARLLRQTLEPLHELLPAQMISGKMSAAFDKVIKSDTLHVKGERQLADGDLSLLKGFEWNPGYSLYDALHITPAVDNNIPEKIVSVTIPSFVPAKKITAPAGATHFRIISCTSVLMLLQNCAAMDHRQTALLLLNNKATGVITLQHSIENAGGEVMILTTGIVFYKQSAAGVIQPMKEGALCLMAAGKL